MAVCRDRNQDRDRNRLGPSDLFAVAPEGIDMGFPDAETIATTLDPVEFPTFATVEYDPPTPELNDPAAAAREAVGQLPLAELEPGARVAVGLGSRGITDIVTIARATIDELRERGIEPVVVPAMGSHGGATPEGQRETLSGLGLTEEALDCRIDARMEVKTIGEGEDGDGNGTGTGIDEPVHLARAALEADAMLAVNRVKPHTNFDGSVESGLCKMLAVGFGKHRGAQAFHRRALDRGYVPTITDTVERIVESTTVLGGIAIVENFHDRTAHVEGMPVDALPGQESTLLECAREYMPTLPFEELDVLVVDRIGKDVSGAGMDTNVIGRYEVLNADDPPVPDIDRIVVRGLTEATHGNGQGIGLADITTVEVLESLDLDQVYTNALTSSSLSKARLPVALPTDEHALTAAVSTIGSYDPETVRIAWISDTGHLSRFRISEALVAGLPGHGSVTGRERLVFEDGSPRFEDQ